ncbi:hypothetical protein L6452_17065 [Arctium lappa]|uniref:Uncharacterized protein n=1 Tax=Arctium lappa TaxID=4217 RepID=A0ACB9C2F3_ARCLA|nr:hypothetical protein L6452_17065 [Arctium lappa]
MLAVTQKRSFFIEVVIWQRQKAEPVAGWLTETTGRIIPMRSAVLLHHPPLRSSSVSSSLSLSLSPAN